MKGGIQKWKQTTKSHWMLMEEKTKQNAHVYSLDEDKRIFDITKTKYERNSEPMNMHSIK